VPFKVELLAQTLAMVEFGDMLPKCFKTYSKKETSTGVISAVNKSRPTILHAKSVIYLRVWGL
jgi:hypothetical protein